MTVNDYVGTTIARPLVGVNTDIHTACMTRGSISQGAADTPFVRWLLEIAETRGWTSGRQAAKYLGINQAAFATWLRGDFTPNSESQARLAEKTGEPYETIARLVAASRPNETDRFLKDSGGLSPGIMRALAEQVAERTAGAVLKSLSPLFHHLAPDHFTEDEWLRLAKRRVIERVEGAAMAAGELGGMAGQARRGDRQVLWEVRVRGACMEPVIPDGSLVLVDRRTAEPGETVAVNIGDDVMVKRLVVHNGERVLVTEGGKIIRPGAEGRVMGVVAYIPTPRHATELR
jgi:transcriptional regulator with XRE-family HTH domain